ncbi:rhomboid family intramembrane serine protease [Halorubrum sp. SD626R]|uniref:rhomboid family intramembrane serine protease n=1 Tax=Halorubrum sp. SD626R TaxID=1419722 RepID=UPI0010F9749E|nr:rhomboid family intramembrane serine protease [Halorubrum sp. SD626R]TKX81170.1 rhomboid family intramembrane serine protease [Halorubrum sp. SD626R]
MRGEGDRVDGDVDGPASDGDPDDPSTAGDPAPPTLRGLLARVRAAARSQPPRDLFLIAVPLPALLVAVSLTPGTDAWRLSLATDGVFESRWALWTAFASSFVHASPAHLIDNLVNYWLLVAVAYPLSVVAGWRGRLLGSTAIYLAVVPLVSAWATIVALGGLTNAPTAGFSDVNSALLGYVVVVWFAALATETGAEGGRDPGSAAGVDARWAVVAALGSLAVAYLAPSGVGYFPSLPAVGSLFALCAALVAAGLYVGVGRPRVVGLGLAPERELLYVTGASVAAAGVIGSLVVVPFGSNVFAHLAGYVVGVAVPLVGVVLDG